MIVSKFFSVGQPVSNRGSYSGEGPRSARLSGGPAGDVPSLAAAGEERAGVGACVTLEEALAGKTIMTHETGSVNQLELEYTGE